MKNLFKIIFFRFVLHYKCISNTQCEIAKKPSIILIKTRIFFTCFPPKDMSGVHLRDICHKKAF